MLALLGVHPILHVSRIRVKNRLKLPDLKETTKTLQIFAKLAIIKFSNYVFVLSLLSSFLQTQVKND